MEYRKLSIVLLVTVFVISFPACKGDDGDDDDEDGDDDGEDGGEDAAEEKD